MASNTVVGAISVAIGATIGAGFKTAISQAEHQLGRLGDAISQVQGQSSKLAAFKRQEAAVKAAGKEWLAARQRLEELKREIRETDQPTNRMRQAIVRAAQAADGARGAYLAQKTALGTMRAEIERAGISTRNLTVEERRLGATLDTLKKKYEALAQTNARIDAVKERRADLRGQAMDVIALGAAFGAPIKAAMDLESAQVRLGTVINATAQAGETQAQAVARAMVEARRQAVAFSSGGMTTANEMIDIQYALNSAGLEAGVAKAGASVVAKVATVTNGVPEQVGEVVATVFNNMGSQFSGAAEEKMQRIGDLLTRTQFKYQIRDFGQLGESMKNATPAILSNNMALEQGLALLGALNTAGLQGGEAGTALSATLRQMSKAAQEFGFDLAKTKDNQLDMVATMENMEAAIGGFGESMDQDVKDKLQQVFGDEGVKAVHLLGKELSRLRKDQDDLAASSRGIVDKAYEGFVKSSAGQMKILGNNVTNAAAAFGTLLLPGINAVITPLVSVVQVGASLAENFPILTTAVIGVATGLVGLKLASIGLGYAWTFVSGGALVVKKAILGVQVAYALATGRTVAFSAATQLATARMAMMGAGGAIRSAIAGVTAFGATLWGVAVRAFPAVITGLRALGVAFMTNPIGLVIGGIALAAGLIISNWETVGPFFERLWGDITGALGVAWEWMKTILSWTPAGLVVRLWQALPDGLAGVWSAVVDGASDAWDWLKAAIAWSPADLVTEAWSVLPDLLGGIWDRVLQAASAVWSRVSELVTAPIRSVRDTLGKAWNWVTGDGDGTAAGSSAPPQPSSTGGSGPAGGVAGLAARTGRGLAATAGTVAALAAPATAAPPPAVVDGGFNMTVNFSITAAPGTDPRVLATEIRRQINQVLREAEARRRAANHD
ncbi:phage tail tape measure protein [Tistrella mobilis]